MNVPQAFFLRNHVSSELLQADLADLPKLSKRPEFADKKSYAGWCHAADTRHVFYTLAEPGVAGLRGSGQNPIKFMHGVVADYDGNPDAIAATLARGLTFKRPELAPTWVTRTFSKKARLIWCFEHKVPVFGGEVFAKFLERIFKELDCYNILPGLDVGAAIANPYTPFELGTEWYQPCGDARVPGVKVMAILHEVSNRAKWKVDGPEIPFDAVADEVERRWPGRWPCRIAEGARGVRFWDKNADNETGCTIRSNGVQAWTGECKFIPWHELLGDDFVKKYKEDRIGGAIDGTYYDGKAYWRKDALAIWRARSGDDIRRHLNVLHGLSSETKKGKASEVNEALTTIDMLRTVDGAFPVLFRKEEVVYDPQSRKKYLNISRAEPMKALSPGRAWGDGFPWMARYFTGLFDQKQQDVFFTWLHHAWSNAVAGTPRKGQAMFITGPTSAGKTLLSQRIIAGILGGFAEATAFITGETHFNEDLFHSPVWAVDDAVSATDQRKHALYSQIVKKVVANPKLEYHPKFGKQVTFYFNGRLVVTMNDDAHSIGMFPQVEGSILDKIVAVLAKAPGVSFAGVEDIIRAELPAFVDWLAGWVKPAWLQSNPDENARFGMDAWVHPDLLATAREAATSNSLLELLDCWRVHYFNATPSKTEWRGTIFDLYLDISNNEVLGKVLPRFATSVYVMARDLKTAIRQGGCAWLKDYRTSTSRGYSISKPESLK